MKLTTALVMAGFALAASLSNWGEAVQVTLSLDKPKISLGEKTTLHVRAEIVPGQKPVSDRIFGWYVDLLNTDSTVAEANGATLIRAASDKDPRTSSGGTVEGPNIRGIYDTFINLAGAGKESPVELFSIEVGAVKAGKTTFQIRAGTGVAGDSPDFLVAPLDAGDPLLGGDYSLANIELEVTEQIEAPRLSVSVSGAPPQKEITISYPISAGRNYFVEFQETLNPAAAWEPLPGNPHNSGQAREMIGAGNRFYRVRVE